MIGKLQATFRHWIAKQAMWKRQNNENRQETQMTDINFVKILCSYEMDMNSTSPSKGKKYTEDYVLDLAML